MFGSATDTIPARPRVFLTGGGSGLGRAFALQLARRGGRILVTDIRSDAAVAVTEEVRALGGEAHALTLDVGELAAVQGAAQWMQQSFGGVDLVINNAGIAVAGRVGEASLEDWHFVMRVNLFGVIHGCHVFAPILRAAGRGAILNVASAAGFASLPEMGPYNVSKAAVIALTETLRAELGPAGIAVSALCPTFFPTNLMDSFRAPDPRQRKLAEALFARARATADEVAAAGLAGLEAGRLITVPQRDGRLMRVFKGLAPEVYAQVLAGPLFRRLTSRLSGETASDA